MSEGKKLERDFKVFVVRRFILSSDVEGERRGEVSGGDGGSSKYLKRFC